MTADDLLLLLLCLSAFLLLLGLFSGAQRRAEMKCQRRADR